MTERIRNRGRSSPRPVRLQSAASVDSAPRSPEVALTLAEVERIAAMTDPAARNTAITASYFRLSDALGEWTGRENANWASFAAWASATAGRAIRQEGVPRWLVDAVHGRGPVAEATEALRAALAPLGLREVPALDDLFMALRQTPDEITAGIGDGNRRVFAEMGRELVLFLDSFAGQTAPDPAKLDRYLAHFPPEQAALVVAFANYHAARFEPDPSWKAQQILLANLQIAEHEQRRIQADIDAALGAPIEELLRPVLHNVFLAPLDQLPAVGDAASAAAEQLLEPMVTAIAAAWRHDATEHSITLYLPDGGHVLGVDLRRTPGARADFPAALQEIHNPELRGLLDRMDRSPDLLRGSGADDWSRLDDRMNYIADLFRSRQQSEALWLD